MFDIVILSFAHLLHLVCYAGLAILHVRFGYDVKHRSDVSAEQNSLDQSDTAYHLFAYGGLAIAAGFETVEFIVVLIEKL